MASLRSAEVAELALAPVADLPVNELRSMMYVFVEDGLGRGCGEGGVEAFRTSRAGQTRGFLSTHDYVTLTLQPRSSTFGDVWQKLIFRSRRRNVPVGPLCVCKRCSAKPHFLLVPEFRRAEPRSIVDPSIARRLCNPPSSNTQPTFERRLALSIGQARQELQFDLERLRTDSSAAILGFTRPSSGYLSKGDRDIATACLGLRKAWWWPQRAL